MGTEHNGADGNAGQDAAKRPSGKIDRELLTIIEAITSGKLDPPSIPSPLSGDAKQSSPRSPRTERLFARVVLPPSHSAGTLQRRNATRARSTSASNDFARPPVSVSVSASVSVSVDSDGKPLRIDTSGRRLSEPGQLATRSATLISAGTLSSGTDSTESLAMRSSTSDPEDSYPSLVFPVAQLLTPLTASEVASLPLLPIRYRSPSAPLGRTPSRPLPAPPSRDPLRLGTAHHSPAKTQHDRHSSPSPSNAPQGPMPTLTLPNLLPRSGDREAAPPGAPTPPGPSSEAIEAARVEARRRRMTEQFLADRKARRRSALAGRAMDDTALTDGYVLVSPWRGGDPPAVAVHDEEPEADGKGGVWDREASAVMETLEETRRTSSEFRDWERKQRSELARRKLQAEIISPS